MPQSSSPCSALLEPAGSFRPPAGGLTDQLLNIMESLSLVFSQISSFGFLSSSFSQYKTKKQVTMFFFHEMELSSYPTVVNSYYFLKILRTILVIGLHITFHFLQYIDSLTT